MMRQAASQWTWVPPMDDTRTYAVVKWKTGHYYAGPAEAALALPANLVDTDTMHYCSRADAMRLAMNSKVSA